MDYINNICKMRYVFVYEGLIENLKIGSCAEK